MSKEKIILGLSGPSAVGKGYCKDRIKEKFKDTFSEPVIVTTRPKREKDGPDRKAGVSVSDFLEMKKNGLILFSHQPFKTDWYGFLASSFEDGDKHILTEVHPENITGFKYKYGSRVILLGLIANKDYLELNIRSRGTESEELIRERILASADESSVIQKFAENGLVDHLIEVTPSNRFNLDKIVINLTREIITR